MADDTTTTGEAAATATETGDTTTTDTTAGKADETSGTPDVSGLKSALEAERKQRADAEKAVKAAKAELEKARKASMSDAEKAVAEAEAKGRTAAATEYGKRLAAAELRAAAASKGVDLSEIGDLIDSARFVGDDGEVDSKAIEAAVAKLAKLTPAKPTAPPRGSGEFAGSPGTGTPITEEQLARMSPDQIAKALNEGKLKHLL